MRPPFRGVETGARERHEGIVALQSPARRQHRIERVPIVALAREAREKAYEDVALRVAAANAGQFAQQTVEIDGGRAAVRQIQNGARQRSADARAHALLLVAGRSGRRKGRHKIARRCKTSRRHERDEIMQRGESQGRVLHPRLRDGRRTGPAGANVDAELFDPRQQGDRVRHVAKVIAGAWPDLLVEQRKRMADAPEFEMQQRRVPTHVQREIIAVAPGRAARLDPGQAIGGAARHLMHMADRVDRPGILRLDVDRLAAEALGGVIGAHFLEREGPASQQEAMAGMIERQCRERPVDAGQHAHRVAGHEPQGMRQLGEQETFRTGFEPVIEDIGGRGEPATRGMIKRRHEASLVRRSADTREAEPRISQIDPRGDHRLRSGQHDIGEPRQRVGRDKIRRDAERDADRVAGPGPVRCHRAGRLLERHDGGAVGGLDLKSKSVDLHVVSPASQSIRAGGRHCYIGKVSITRSCS